MNNKIKELHEKLICPILTKDSFLTNISFLCKPP